MTSLNYDCLDALFSNFSESQDGCNLLYTCALLNREWRTAAVRHLYKDPWKYWLYQRKDDEIAKQLIDTYWLCYKYNENKNKTRASCPSKEGDENPSKRVAVEDDRDRTDDDYNIIPLHNYILYAKNLHVPSLYQCVKLWYKSYHNDEENVQSIYEYFLKIFELFVKEAKIRDCTFAESTEDDNCPLKFDQLDRLINHGQKVDLKYLNLGYFQCDSDNLSRITGKCNNLKTFKISAQKCSDEALAKFITKQKRLTKLKIRNAEKIDLTLDALGTQSKSLVKLRILSSKLKSCQNPFNGIAACSNLRSIYMRKIEWSTDVSVSTLLMPVARECEFHNVDFSFTYLPADVLVEIAKKSSSTLRKVHLMGHEDQINHESYDLSAGILSLADHSKNIVHFERDILPREIESMIYFLNTAANSLIRLEIESKFMKSIDASNLLNSISNCSKLEILNITSFNFTPQAFENLILSCKLLTILTIGNSMSVNDDILNIIQEKCNENLKNLEIFACSEVTEDAVEQLRDKLRKTEIDVSYGEYV